MGFAWGREALKMLNNLFNGYTHHYFMTIADINSNILVIVGEIMKENYEKYLSSVSVGLYFKKLSFSVCKSFYDIIDALGSIESLNFKDVSANVFEINANVGGHAIKLTPNFLVLTSRLIVNKDIKKEFNSDDVHPKLLVPTGDVPIHKVEAISDPQKYIKEFLIMTSSIIELISSRPNFKFPNLKFLGISKSFCFPISIGKFKYFSNYEKCDSNYSNGELEYKKRFIFLDSSIEKANDEFVFSHYSPDYRRLGKKNDKYQVYGSILDLQVHSSSDDGISIEAFGNSLHSCFLEREITAKNYVDKYGIMDIKQNK